MCWKGDPGPQGALGAGCGEQIDSESVSSLGEMMPALIVSMQKALDEGRILGYGGVTLSPPMLQDTY